MSNAAAVVIENEVAEARPRPEPRMVVSNTHKAGDDIEITFPSGLRGRIRGLVGRDFKLFNRATAKTGEGVTKILNSCWVETVDPGIYRADASGRVNFADVLVGDRFYGIVGIRMAMYPPGCDEEMYTFKVHCTDPGCRATIEWQVKLADLPVRKLPKATADKLVAGVNEFETKLDDGTVVTFALQNGRGQAKAHRLQQHLTRHAERGQKPADIVLALAARIVRISGVEVDEDDEHTAYEQKVAWLEDLRGPMHRRILRAIEKADCGIETEIEVECDECGARQELDLPFDATFLFPK